MIICSNCRFYGGLGKVWVHGMWTPKEVTGHICGRPSIVTGKPINLSCYDERDYGVCGQSGTLYEAKTDAETASIKRSGHQRQRNKPSKH